MRVDSGEHKLCEEEKMCIKCVSFMYRNIYVLCMAICMIIHTQNDTYVVYIHPNMYVMFFFVCFVYTHQKAIRVYITTR